MSKAFVIKFTVEGGNELPLDMLRYDQCYPRTEIDANVAMEYRKRQVTLITPQRHAHWCPTVERWLSFGWKVISVEIVA